MTQLLTPEEVARVLGIPTSRLARWRANSPAPNCPARGPRWVKLGRDVRYRREDLDAWIESASSTDEDADADDQLLDAAGVAK